MQNISTSRKYIHEQMSCRLHLVAQVLLFFLFPWGILQSSVPSVLFYEEAGRVKGFFLLLFIGVFAPWETSVLLASIRTTSDPVLKGRA